MDWLTSACKNSVQRNIEIVKSYAEQTHKNDCKLYKASILNETACTSTSKVEFNTNTATLYTLPKAADFHIVLPYL